MRPVTRALLDTLSPREAAALWRIQKDVGGPVEAGLFEEWLARAPANHEAWQRVEAAWTLFADHDDTAFAGVRKAALANAGPPSRFNLRTLTWTGAAAAAMVALVVGGVETGIIPLRSSGSQPIGAAETGPWQSYAAAGAARSVALADGTMLSLAEGAAVRVTYTPGMRHAVVTRGTVRFAVRHMPARPFMVTALDRRILDLGTRFEVAIQSDALSISLFEGSVRVDGGAATQLLRPGQRLVSQPGHRDRIEQISSAARSGPEVVEFQDVTLAHAAEVINRGSAHKLVVSDPSVARLRLSGRFRTGDADRFARTVAALLSLRVARVSPTQIDLRQRR